ncbi:hypothetical protein [Salinispora arenicola]|uniref:hypothetical protein n=1 Tax=Salinispora arenicola TaxID=168697 RepID=UPI0003A46418|nr:hypothetical protein [Salinispora arenicola]
MSIDRSRLPHGITLPTTLGEDDAAAVVQALAAAYGWAHLLFSRHDIHPHLAANRGIAASDQPRRRLTNEEWRRISNTDAWQKLPTTIRPTATTPLRAAITAAALECIQCQTSLNGPPTATWGHCPTCLNRADLVDLQRLPCPTAGVHTPHLWGHSTCRRCNIPRPTRRLAAVPAA